MGRVGPQTLAGAPFGGEQWLEGLVVTVVLFASLTGRVLSARAPSPGRP